MPEANSRRAHGQLTPTELEDENVAFYDGGYDILLSTTIVEFGLDVPNANTLIVYRAETWTGAALSVARPRRSLQDARLRAVYDAAGRNRAAGAEKRLEVLQSLDTLGAGFSLAIPRS